MSEFKDLINQKKNLQDKIKQTEEMVGKELGWKDAQFYLEKYRQEVRVLDNKIAKVQLGEDITTELRTKEKQLVDKLKILEQMKSKQEISEKIYKDKRKELERAIEQVKRDLIDAM